VGIVFKKSNKLKNKRAKQFKTMQAVDMQLCQLQCFSGHKSDY